MKILFKLSQISCLIGMILLLSVLQLKAQRDPHKWPFASNSIWNMPIHNNAVYANINLPAPTGHGVTVDEDIIILKPNAPITAVNTNTVDWTNGADRCPATGANLRFFVNFGERLLRNKKDSSIQNINTLLLLPFSYILNAKSFLEVGYK